MTSIFGIPETIKEVVTEIPGSIRTRFRFRNNCFGYAFVKTVDGIRKFAVFERPDGLWELGCEQARNVK